MRFLSVWCALYRLIIQLIRVPQLWFLSFLSEFVDVFAPPTGVPPSQLIEHSIDLIPGTSLPNAATYHLAPHEAEEIERQLQQLLNSGHIQPSSSPCASPAFITPRKETNEWCLVTDY